MSFRIYSFIHLSAKYSLVSFSYFLFLSFLTLIIIDNIVVVYTFA